MPRFAVGGAVFGAFVAVAACESFESSGAADAPAAAVDGGDGVDGGDAGGGGADGGGQAGADGGGADSVVALSGGGAFACALHARGGVSCWGRNNELQVGVSGDGDLAGDLSSRARPDPIRVAGIADATHLATGLATACVRHASGKVSCWGSDQGLGALGQGPGAPSSSAMPLPLALPPALDVTVGFVNGCARVAGDGGVDVYCWGSNRAGLVGTTASVTVFPPTRVPSLRGAKAVVLSSSFEMGCAIRSDDTVVCWGGNEQGEVGNGSAGQACRFGKCSPAPQPVGLQPGAARIGAGANATYAQVTDGSHRAWGANPDGRLGHAPGTSSDLQACGGRASGRCNPLPQAFAIP